MNREIKFRGKCVPDSKYAGEWAFGSLIVGLECDYYILEYDDEGFTKCIVESETVGQFTGMKDKNGREIFEGDIVEVTCLEVKQFGRKMLCSIMYDEEFACYCFKASDRRRCMAATIPDAEIEVIGNIHENPEMIKKDRR